MSTDSTTSAIPRMGAEGGFDPEEAVAPFRVSGILSLVFGLLSPLALAGITALFLPLLGLIFGLFSIRRHGELVPAGIGIGKAGLLLTVAFGSCAVGIHYLKHRTLAQQAEKFTRDYIEVVANNHVEMGLQLKQSYVNRFSKTMSLKAHYALMEERRQAQGDLDSENPIIAFANNGVNALIRSRGPGHQWDLAQSTRVYQYRGKQVAEVYLIDSADPDAKMMIFILEYRVDPDGNGQWHMEDVTFEGIRLVAPQVL